MMNNLVEVYIGKFQCDFLKRGKYIQFHSGSFDAFVSLQKRSKFKPYANIC